LIASFIVAPKHGTCTRSPFSSNLPGHPTYIRTFDKH
jgi:hypothetical protein